MTHFIFSVLLTFSILLPQNLGAKELNTKLKVGDILLQPLHCWVCNLIEAQEDSIYSHVGIVVDIDPQVKVVEAFSPIVKIVNFEQFNFKTQKQQNLRVLRPYKDISKELIWSVTKKYLNIPYDSHFLWDDNKIYCSELVKKILDELDIATPELKLMLFDRNPEYWDKFFEGNTPRGELGVSPEDFLRSGLYQDLGEI